MKFPDMLRTAFLNLWRRKLRAFLTVLGMVIGTSSIVVMVSLGIGMREAMIESYSQMGSMTNITVRRWSYTVDENGNGSSTEKDLTKKTIEEFKLIPGVEAIESGATCCGIAGTYGLKKEKYEIAQAVGKPLFDKVRDVNPEFAMCDTETCRWQIRKGSGAAVEHPIFLVHQAYGLS